MNTIKKMIDWVSGRYIKTVSNETIFGEGNIAGGTGSVNWGDVGGNLSNQTDLRSELDNKLDKLTDEGEFVYTHEGSIQNSKGFIAGDTLLNSSAHVPSAHTVKKYVDDTVAAIINDTIESGTTTWSSEKIQDMLDALSGRATIIVVDTLPATLQDNTLYYVGTQSPYHIWLRSNGVTYDMGTTEIDLSNYYTKAQTNTLLADKADKTDTYTKTQTDTLLNAKQDTLVSGTNIKTINNESILGSGNIEVKGGVGTETSLWDGNKTGDYSFTLSENWHDYDYIKFACKDGGSYIPICTISVSSLESAFNNSTYVQILIPIAWNETDRRIILFKNGSSDTVFKINMNGGVYLTKIVGIKGNIDISTLQLQSGITSGTSSIASGTNSWQITITLPSNVTPTGYFCSTEGNVGTVYISTVTKISDTQYKLSGWATVGSGATVKAQISWVKLTI